MKFLVFLLIFLANITFSAHAANPNITLNFGQLPFRAIRDTTIYIHAKAQPLVIQKVDIKCVCTKVAWPKQPIMPGDSAALKVTFKALEKGVFYKTVFVKTSQSSVPLEIIVRGTVK